MMTEATPHFDAVLERYPGLFDREDEWVALVADPEHELVPVPEPSFSELLDQLTANLPDEVVVETERSVTSELLVRAFNALEGKEDGDGGDDEDRPDGAAGGTDPAGAAMVARDGSEGGVGVDGGERPAPGCDPGPAPGAAREG